MSGALTIVFRSCIIIACIIISTVFFLLEDPSVDIIIIDRAVGYSKYNELLIPIL
jgi:hypothetical protein